MEVLSLGHVETLSICSVRTTTLSKSFDIKPFTILHHNNSRNAMHTSHDYMASKHNITSGMQQNNESNVVDAYS